MRCLLLCCFFLSSLSAVADEKSEAMDGLLRAFGAENGDTSRLLDVRRAINDKLFAVAAREFDGGDFPTWGDKGELVVEFSDYQCGYCKRMLPSLQNAVQNGEARVIVVEFPILGPLSDRAARYALLARRQGRYDEFHQRLMGGGRLSEEELENAAEEVGLDTEQLLEAESAAAVDAALERNFKLARLLDVSSTPSFIINGVLIRGALPEENFRRLLSDAGE